METTLNRMFQESVRRYAFLPALLEKTDSDYKTVAYREVGEKVRTFASGLVALKIRKGDRIAVVCENRPEWAIADMGIMHIGAINVAIFPTLPAGQVEYILSDSGCRMIIVSDRTQLAKALEVKKALPNLVIVAIDCSADTEHNVITFDGIVKCGADSPLSDRDYEQRWLSVQPNDPASIVYTSGSTGDPKGVVLSHNNFASNVEGAQDVLRFQPGDVLLSFVPLNHCMGRLADYYLPLSCGATIAYVENPRHLREKMAEVEPHYMVLVPRVFEMFRDGLLSKVAKQSPVKQRLFHWALSVGRRRCERLQNARRVSLLLAIKWSLASTLVFRKIQKLLGLQRLKLFISGSAPLPRATAEFFCAMGLTVLEGYGLTETSPVVAVNRPERVKFGTVGPPLKDVEVKIAGDGEILVRGPNVMQCYYNKPDKTAEAIDSDGWFHTGDIGELDEDGYLKITDRKKDLLVLASGKKVAPQPIESSLKASTYISQIVLLGDEQSTVTALIVPVFERVMDWAKQHGINVNVEDRGELARNPEVNRLIRTEIQRLSGDLADYERVHRFSLMDHEFTVENGEMTPTLKVKRHVVTKKYEDVIATMYRR